MYHVTSRLVALTALAALSGPTHAGVPHGVTGGCRFVLLGGTNSSQVMVLVAASRDAGDEIAAATTVSCDVVVDEAVTYPTAATMPGETATAVTVLSVPLGQIMICWRGAVAYVDSHVATAGPVCVG